MSRNDAEFDPVRVVRVTAETEFEIVLRPRTGRTPSLELPNLLLAHFLDHFCKATGIEIEVLRTDWPGSWAFDHVLCEDLGQLVGRGVAEIHARRAAQYGVLGRGQADCCMDDAQADLTLSLEGRPRAEWSVPTGEQIDGFVDLWYVGGRAAGSAYGTNLRQFLDGFALGAGATLRVHARSVGNLHHFYEVVFRALGDAVRGALELRGGRVCGDQSGLAGVCRYEIRTVQETDGGPR